MFDMPWFNLIYASSIHAVSGVLCILTWTIHTLITGTDRNPSPYNILHTVIFMRMGKGNFVSATKNYKMLGWIILWDEKKKQVENGMFVRQEVLLLYLKNMQKYYPLCQLTEQLTNTTGTFNGAFLNLSAKHLGIWPFPDVTLLLTHRGPVTQYCGGSILCKNPIFFTMKKFPRI